MRQQENKSGLLRFARNDDKNMTPPSRGAMRPRFCISCPSKNRRAQGKPGARCTRSRACSVESTRVSHHRFTGTPGLPCAMVLRLIPSSPRGPGLFAPVIGEISSTNLTPASGRQDHTTSPSASAPFVRAKCLRCVAVASIASRLNVRDDRDTSLL